MSALSLEESIRNEDDFLFQYYTQMKASWRDVYPKVSSIPKGKRITPDIDLLEIQKYKQPPLIIGHELKLVRKTDPYGPFYGGLGQALGYFRHGVDQAYLVLGCFNMPSERMDEIQTTIKAVIDFFKQAGLNLLEYMLVPMYKGNLTFRLVLLTLDENSKFSVSSHKEAEHRRGCLLRGEFEWGKRWLRNQEKRTAEALKRESTQSSESP